MSKEDLLKPFPKELVKPAPAGKFGDYVPHANYVERLRDSGVVYSWHCEPVYGRVDGVKRIVGAKGTITIEGMGTYEGFGDVDTFKINNAKFNDGTNLKDAESDAFKRACMRFGLGVELWSGSTQTEEEASAEAGREANVEVQKVDMRKKENKPTAEDTAAMNAIMDSIVGEGESEAPF
jgi:predicted dehydrogenase